MIANMVVGGKEANSANLQNCQPVSRDAASTMLNVSERSIADAAERKRIYEAKSGPAKAIGARATHQVAVLVYGVRWAECDRRSSLRAPQRNRNELGETTVNKTWRKHLPWQEKSTT
jgi:hypothetical protein